MNERIQNLVRMGSLGEHPASDSEVVGLWDHAVEAYVDACLTNRSPNRRLVSAYDAGRGAATALVRAVNLRVRAHNHHETTITTASFLGGDELTVPLRRLEKLRGDRIEVEYGFDAWFSESDIQRILPTIREILTRIRVQMVEERPALSDRLAAVPEAAG